MKDSISSFTGTVKEEIIAKPFEDARVKTLLSAFFKVNGRYLISNKTSRLELKSEYAKIAKYLYVQIKRLYGIDPRFAYTQTARFGKKTTYHVIIEQAVEDILADLNISFTGAFSLRDYLRTDDQIAGYLAGVFLAAGSVNHPESSNYHLEMASPDGNFINEVARLLGHYKKVRFEPKITMRRAQTVVYLKKSDQIADFLIMIGATDATLEYENIRVTRDFSNSDNRWQICETANMERTIKAAANHIEDIKHLEGLIGLDHLPNEKMTVLARLRLEDESASLLELAVRMSDILGKPISKSNVNHLLRAIRQLARRYQTDGR